MPSAQGGGFAGTIQAFVPNELVEHYKTGMEEVFGSGACDVLKIRKYGGIRGNLGLRWIGEMCDD